MYSQVLLFWGVHCSPSNYQSPLQLLSPRYKRNHAKRRSETTRKDDFAMYSQARLYATLRCPRLHRSASTHTRLLPNHADAASRTVLSRVLMAYGRIQRNTEIDQNNFTTSCEKLPPEDVISSGRVRSVLFRKRFGFSAYSRLPHGPGTLPYSAPVATPPTRASEENKIRRRLYGYIYAKPYPPPPPAQCW